MNKSYIKLLSILFALFLLMPAAQLFAAQNYTVQPGDNLFRIALNHGMSTEQLAAANQIDPPYAIYVGQIIVIPGEETIVPPASITEGLSLTEPEEVIAESTGRSTRTLTALVNKRILLPEGKELPEPVADLPDATDEAALVSRELPDAAPVERVNETYVVRQGDTLAKIARRFNISIRELAQANQISNPNMLHAGQVLIVPALPDGYQERWIDIDLTTQTLTAYEGDKAVFSTLISSGLAPYYTVTGEFRVWLRYDKQDMNGYLLGYDYFIRDVPFVMYFFEDYAIHGAPWHNNFGNPMSHGCINVAVPDAEWLFQWSGYGTLVRVHY